MKSYNGKDWWVLSPFVSQDKKILRVRDVHKNLPRKFPVLRDKWDLKSIKYIANFGYLQLIWHFLIQNETILFFPLYLHVMYPGPLRKSYGDKTLFFVIPYYSAFETQLLEYMLQPERETHFSLTNWQYVHKKPWIVFEFGAKIN